MHATQPNTWMICECFNQFKIGMNSKQDYSRLANFVDKHFVPFDTVSVSLFWYIVCHVVRDKLLSLGAGRLGNLWPLKMWFHFPRNPICLKIAVPRVQRHHIIVPSSELDNESVWKILVSTGASISEIQAIFTNYGAFRGQRSPYLLSHFQLAVPGERAKSWNAYSQT